MKPLITNSEEFDQIMHSLANGVTIQNAQGQLIFVNAVAAEMMRCDSPAAAVKLGGIAIMQQFELFDEHGKSLNLAELPGRQALQGVEEPEKIVGFKAHSEPSIRWTSIKAKPVFNESGKLKLAINVLQDITALKETENRLREANERITALLEQALSPSR